MKNKSEKSDYNKYQPVRNYIFLQYVIISTPFSFSRDYFCEAE